MPSPLPGRLNALFTNKFLEREDIEQIRGDVCEALKNLKQTNRRKNIFVIGGPNLILQSRPVLDKVYVTRIPGEYLNDTSMNSTVSGQGNYYNDTEYLRTQTASTYCRFTASRTKTISGRNRGDTYEVYWYGNEYSIINTGWTYSKQPSGEQSVYKAVYIRGRRIDSATAPTIVQTLKGNTEIAFNADGTPSGPDGTVNIFSDGITRTYEYSTDGSTGWTTCPSVVTLNASLLLTTVYFSSPS
jgi:hypothetical protein